MKNDFRKEIRDFFVRKIDKLLDLELLCENQPSYWCLTLAGKNFFNTNLILLKKIDLQEVWQSIPTRLKLAMELYYNFMHNNISIEEVYKKIDKKKFWIMLDYGCLLFYENYYQKENFLKEGER